MAREPDPLLAHPGFEIGDQRRTQLLASRAVLLGRPAVDGPLDLEQPIDAPDGLETSGEFGAGALPSALRRALASISASAKNGRRACAQQAASWIGVGVRSATFSWL
jgi:hypothetical protein